MKKHAILVGLCCNAAHVAILLLLHAAGPGFFEPATWDAIVLTSGLVCAVLVWSIVIFFIVLHEIDVRKAGRSSDASGDSEAVAR